jgi:hypothetical protein
VLETFPKWAVETLLARNRRNPSLSSDAEDVHACRTMRCWALLQQAHRHPNLKPKAPTWTILCEHADHKTNSVLFSVRFHSQVPSFIFPSPTQVVSNTHILNLAEALGLGGKRSKAKVHVQALLQEIFAVAYSIRSRLETKDVTYGIAMNSSKRSWIRWRIPEFIEETSSTTRREKSRKIRQLSHPRQPRSSFSGSCHNPCWGAHNRKKIIPTCA